MSCCWMTSCFHAIVVVERFLFGFDYYLPSAKIIPSAKIMIIVENYQQRSVWLFGGRRFFVLVTNIVCECQILWVVTLTSVFDRMLIL